jgi:hypothetical protein
MHLSATFLVLGTAQARGGLQRIINPLNTAGNCKFGKEFCDPHGRSYGCERFNDEIGVCWSECVGNIIKPSNNAETMKYDGWCYNLNETVLNPPIAISGKEARYRRDDGHDGAHDDYEEYDWEAAMDQIGRDGFIMGVPIHQYHSCKVDSDCEPLMLRGCTIGCGNFPEYKEKGISNLNYLPLN